MRRLLFQTVMALLLGRVSCGPGDVIALPLPNPCLLQKESGTCTDSLERYFYNPKTCQCEKFVYTGCGGNGNNFQTSIDCLNKCSDYRLSCPICNEPKKVGPCEALIKRYYYNKATCRCEEFFWGGCQPNGNNFLSEIQCSKSCGSFLCPVCNLPKVKGPCLAIFPRWFYNVQTCKCEPFTYGGCGANGNNFVSLKDCQTACGDYDCPVCNQPPISGMCLAYMPRYYFNIVTCKCEKFIYGGCGGNNNRFLRLEDCEGSCGTSECPVCNLPAVTGPCKALFRKWFYNINTCQCEEFIYGGCGGNSNRFDTKEQCEGSCQHACPTCLQPKKVGPCRGAFPRYYFNKKTCSCEKFIYGGCQGNGNNFPTLEECENTCDDVEECQGSKCYLPKDPGPCDALIKRFYFNPKTCKCEKFNYGGCQGNSNNFVSKRKCKKACKNASCQTDCNLPMDSGVPQKFNVERYFFNISSCQCEAFKYSGKKGNENNFRRVEECRAVCGDIKCPVCNQPPSKGPCKKKLIRWYFDAKTCKCNTFKYGGCKGNLNRFLSKQDCEGSCGSFPCPVCKLPMKVGPCRAAINRYYYDQTKKKCKKFSWGGCQPNGNNFFTKKACKKVCD